MTEADVQSAQEVNHGRSTARTGLRGRRNNLDSAPLLVFWETTKACPLSCRHCRAEAISAPLPGELSTQEGRLLLDQIAEFGSPPPILVMTGGDAIMRPDLFTLLAHARDNGIRVALSPAVSPRLDAKMALAILDQGVRSVSISVDGVGATHDRIRGLPGHFDDTVATIEMLKAQGLSVQINTTVMSTNVGDLPRIAEMMKRLGVSIWEVFFLIEVGRGVQMNSLTPQENEDVCRFLYDASGHGFIVRTVEGPFYRRVSRCLSEGGVTCLLPPGPLYQTLSSELSSLLGASSTRPKISRMVTRDGTGIVFVSHHGDVFPSGFLPISLGNIKETSLPSIYRDHPLLLDIRKALFSGRCGECTYREICGGSRARAFATYNDPLAQDPACGYTPSTLLNEDRLMP
ncbi:MAG: TIGR04053 family radical SAM/SPASM domain-containing protein [Ferrimicrobium sp.]